MRISLLQEREDFERILWRSLSDFLASYFGRAVPVVPAGQGDVTFRQNARLNVIFPQAIARGRLSDLTAEFRYAPGTARRLAQTAYCMLAVRWPAEIVASRPAFDLVDPPPETAGWVILPGNHSIRVIDTEGNRSLVFRKHGFDETFFLRDAEIRQNADAPLAPKVLQIDPGGLWYVEQRIRGLPLNRLSDRRRADAALSKALGALADLRGRTAQEVPVRTYAAKLVTSVRARLGTLRADLPTDLVSRTEALVDLAGSTLEDAPDTAIVLCQSHGDFQPANILVDDLDVWLIDWEYSATRSALYDFLVFTLQTRFPAGLGERLTTAYQQASAQGGVEIEGLRQAGPPATLVATFLLEELDLKLAEVAAPAITDKTTSLSPWLREVTGAARALFQGQGH